MQKWFAVVVLSVGALVPFQANAQTNICATHANSLFCLPNTLYGTPQATASNPSLPWTPVFSAAGAQLSLLPIPSPASGILLRFDRSKAVYTRVNETLGPILSERAETLGRRKLFLAVDYQRFTFNSIDRVSLKALPIVFQSCDQAFTNNGTFCPGTLTVAATNNRMDLKISQFTMFATVGLTNRLDLSIAVPVLQSNLGMALLSRTILNGPPGNFPPGAVSGGKTGLGDITIRGKGTVLKHGHFGLAGITDLRIPTGDEFNFLGSGAWGVRPAIAASYEARFSPHGNIGYQWNGNSALANPYIAATSANQRQLPTSFFYSVGADLAATRKLTIATDFLSARVFDGLRLSRVNPFGYPSVSPTQNSFTTSDASVGVKINPAGNFLVAVNVAIKLDHHGLRHEPIPLVGLGFTF
jgi:hypothetical protein